MPMLRHSPGLVLAALEVIVRARGAVVRDPGAGGAHAP